MSARSRSQPWWRTERRWYEPKPPGPTFEEALREIIAHPRRKYPPLVLVVESIDFNEKVVRFRPAVEAVR